MRGKLIYVFHNGHKRNEITLDCSLRIAAAENIAQKDPAAIIFFVGGRGISGAKEMQSFWRENYPNLSNETRLLENANNTADAVKDIMNDLLDHEEEKEVVLISSSYHTGRISFFATLNGLKANIIAAEDVLLNDDEFRLKVMTYRNSFIYKLKIIVDRLVLLYATMIDHSQKTVKVWRNWTRKFK